MTDIRAECRQEANALPTGDYHRCLLHACVEAIDDLESRLIEATQRYQNAEAMLPEKQKKFTMGGKTKSVRKWAKEFGISASTVFDRVAAGWTTEKAIRTPVRNDNTHLICGEMISISEAARRYGIAKSTLHGRVKKGLSLAQAIAKEGVDISAE